MDTKTCTNCGVNKPMSEYHKSKRYKDGLHYMCKPCNCAKSKEWSRANKARAKATRLLRQFGITPEQYDQMLADQDGKCAICSGAEPGGHGQWHVDHDHETGVVRGLLCHHCNVGLGHFKDNPDLLLMAGIYLTRQPQHA